MTKYRKTMAEAWNEANLIESGLMGTMTDTQLANIKKVWAKKTMKDVTPSVKNMLDKMDMPTKVAVKHAGINILSKIVLKDELDMSVDVSETYTVVITKKDGSKMELGKYNTPHEAQKFVDMYGKGAKVKKEELQGQKEKNKDELEEGKMSDIDAMKKDGASAKDIAKALKISVATVKDILGEDEQQNKEDLEESFSPAMLAKLKTEFGPLKGKTITAARAKQLMNILDKLKDKDLETLKGAGIPFVSGGAMSKLSVRKMKFKVTTINPFKEETTEESYTVKYVDPLNKKNLRMKHADEKDAQDMMDRLKKAGVKDIKIVKEDLDEASFEEACWVGYKQVGMKNKGGKEVPNCVPEDKEIEEAFAVQITKKDGGKLIHGKYKTKPDAEKFIKWYKTGDMKDTKSIEVVKEEKNCGCGQDPCITYGKKDLDEELLDEMAALRKKADKSGISFSILKKVFDRGMAAWKGGHRPGASQHQWAYARVNSFITKGSGTWGGADKDLAKQARGQKEDLDAVPQDRDVKKKDGTQPKKYYKGLSKDVKGARASHFKNNDSNKEAPGDKDAKTKPSIHTQKYKKMYGEGARELVLKFLKQKMQTSKEEK